MPVNIMPPEHEKLNYVEFPANNLLATKAFFGQVFNWQFQDYSPRYIAFTHAGLDGGFYQSHACSHSVQGAALLVFYSHHLERSLDKIKAAGGVITKPIFDFPGGRRFHFTEPSGNEFAVWSRVA
ncbi:VOC family protein [Marinagarivorans algicola]|uniref:VOC family protein n=1 Tax=Marinagarivorans algicola TaxID=1513270 RepID=UPI003736C7CD